MKEIESQLSLLTFPNLGSWSIGFSLEGWPTGSDLYLAVVFSKKIAPLANH